ncbi:MAG: hypothetical protein LBE60_17825 [Microbacterium sp.]|jgi:hypothetical protein|uniref:hypothetical protein n=1 Tax=Microbacterium sp. TaxID=51671 RepID=UPI0028378A1C|nr:hypothetical protein [Microbacterium sp.]MDR2323492.1 hypothetical protein [Microbacterium sp.]
MDEWNTSELQKSSASDPGRSSSRIIRRRTIVKGAAWSLPVLAAAAAVPLAAASTVPGCATQKTFFTLPDSPSAAGITTVFVVPAKVNLITVTVTGGAGGATRADWTILGGNGGLVTATIPVIPGETLDLIVGQGGASRIGPSYGANPSVVTGGQGYGNGGDSDPAADNPNSGPGSWWGGAPGGAGSAILRGGQPLVVAGGGGGAGGIYGSNWTYYNGGRGGDAGNDGEANWYASGGSRIDLPGGLVSGAAAGAGTFTADGTFFSAPGLATTSRDGAVGAGAATQPWGSGAGAGGGGHQGGGSGSRGGRNGTIALGAGGAGGTSYLDTASGVAGNITTWKQSTTTTARQGGQITIEWCA